MACNKNKLGSIQSRLAKIAKLKAALDQKMQMNKEVDSSTINLSNAQYENKVNIVEGKVRRSVAVQGDEIIPIKNNPNTIDNVLDRLDSNSLNTPKVLPGDFLDQSAVQTQQLVPLMGMQYDDFINPDTGMFFNPELGSFDKVQ